MSKESTVQTMIPLAGTKKGIITVSKITEPYGKQSGPVASIGIALDGNAESPEWKVHIPLENVDSLIEALKNVH